MRKIEELLNKGKIESALKKVKEILASDCSIETKAQAHLLSGRIYERVNVFDKAEIHYQTSLKLFQNVGNKLEEARALHTYLNFKKRQGKFKEAKKMLKQVEGVYKKYGNRVDTARFLYTKGDLALNSGNIQKAVEYYAEAIKIYKREKDYIQANRASLYKAFLLSFQGKIKSAKKALSSAYNFFKEMGYPIDTSITREIMGVIEMNQGNYKRAIKLYEEAKVPYGNAMRYSKALLDEKIGICYENLAVFGKALRYYSDAKKVFKEFGAQDQYAACIWGIGNIHLILGDYDGALSLLNEAEKIYRAEGMEHSHSMVLDTIGIIYREKGELDKAKKIFEGTYEYFKKQKLKEAEATNLIERSIIEILKGDKDNALNLLEKSHNIYRNLHLKKECAEVFFLKGRLWENAGDKTKALFYYTKAETLSSGFPDITGNALFYKGKILESRGKTSNALNLYKQSIENMERVRKGIDIDKLKISFLQDKAEAYRRTVNLLLRENNWKEAFNFIERSKSRALLDLVEGPKAEIKSISEIQPVITPEEAIIEIYLGKSPSIFFINKHTASFIPINVQEDTLKKLTVQFYKNIQEMEYLMEENNVIANEEITVLKKEARNILYSLYQHLLYPLKSLIKDTPRLIIIPHKFLHYIPFTALWDGEHYLIDRYEVQTSLSASLFASLRVQRRKGRGKIAIGNNLKKMEYAEQEIEMLEQIFGKSRIKRDLRAEDFHKVAYRKEMVHICAHSAYNKDAPLLSFIEFSDRKLTALDLLNHKIQSDFISLSGCETGKGEIKEGDEIIGLSRSLLATGAKSTLLNLWKVYDKTSAEIITRFYQGIIKQKISRVSSLRNSIIKIKKDYPHPYYWAGFTLMGGR